MAARFAVETETRPRTDVAVAFEKGWAVLVWNDPVNMMNYVVHVFMKVFRFDKIKATHHMLEVHNQGKSCLTRETRENAEHYCQQLLLHGLQATIQRD